LTVPLADLVRALEQDAAAQVRAVLDGAQARADEIAATAAHAREHTLAREAATCRQRCQAAADEKIAVAQQRARATLLAARAEMLERVRATLLAQLPVHTPRVAQALARAARSCAGDVTYVERSVPTGVVIELASGTQIIASLEALAEREWPRLAAAIVALAAGGQDVATAAGEEPAR
jgi:vacuolar-type H+-ATPase subunit E/Vma4